jgi:hypothetical protein
MKILMIDGAVPELSSECARGTIKVYLVVIHDETDHRDPSDSSLSLQVTLSINALMTDNEFDIALVDMYTLMAG